MSLDAILNIVFFAIGLAIGLLQLYLAQHQFQQQQQEKMNELRGILTSIQQRLAVLEAVSSERAYSVQDKLISLISGDQVVAGFAEETTKQIKSLVEQELRAGGVHESIQKSRQMEEKLERIISREASFLVPQTAGSSDVTLSPQEKEIADLLLLGKSNPEIAEALNISRNTATYFIKRLFTKYEVHDRTEFALKFISQRQRV